MPLEMMMMLVLLMTHSCMNDDAVAVSEVYVCRNQPVCIVRYLNECELLNFESNCFKSFFIFSAGSYFSSRLLGQSLIASFRHDTVELLRALM